MAFSRELPEGDELAHVIEAAAGLTASEAENAFSLALVRHSKLEPETLWELKSQQLKKSGLVSLHGSTENFQQLGGFDNLKAFCLRAMRRQIEGTVSDRPRGVLLLSPPGCGKSQFAKAVGNETGRPMVVLILNALLGSLAGQSESNHPSGPETGRRDGSVRAHGVRSGKSLRRSQFFGPDRPRGDGPRVRLSAHVAERPRERCLLRRHRQ